MVVLGDSNIVGANILSLTPMLYDADNIKDYVLAHYAETDGFILDLVLDYSNEDIIPDVDSIGLCGNNIEKGMDITIEGSNTAYDSPEFTITFKSVYEFTHFIPLGDTYNFKYWRISTHNIESFIKLGFVYIGVKTVYPDPLPVSRNFGSTSSLELAKTRQPYGSKGALYDDLSYSFSVIDEEKMIEIIELYDKVQSYFPVICLTHEDGIINRLNHPVLGTITESSLPTSRRARDGQYSFSQSFGGTF